MDRFIPAKALACIFAVSFQSGCGSPAEETRGSENPSPLASTPCQSEDLNIHVPSPDWRDQIIYFVFTDRFADGDPTNNDLGHGEFNPQKERYFSGGDIPGITNQLDYIEGLGATAVWATPLVLNQWVSRGQDFTGYSGYYGIDFSQLDPHFGTLTEYRELSHALHCREMYLIQDIVVNHTANFFGYDGPYDPNDTSKSFVLLQDETSPQPVPLQKPFDMIDRNNPEHAAANIYNWTPTITDYQNMGEKQYTYQLGSLADVNTKNPVVIDVFKKTYGDWIEKAGIDAIRIDTVRYVEPEFFAQFLHDEDGILARAAATGRDNFLLFGEVLDYSQPFKNTGEAALAEYLDSADQKILPAVISFPLKQEIKSVFGQGKPTAQIAYRLQQHMEMYTDPFVTPTLVDNHDVARFLASGSMDGFKQSFALIFTIPGIPTVYQGSAQGFTETRQAMFSGGYMSDRDHFDTSTELYQFISSLAALRTAQPALRRGSLKMLAANPHEAGLVAYRRSYEGAVLDIIFNTSDEDVLVDGLRLPGVADGPLDIAYAMNVEGPLEVIGERMTAVLPPRAFVVSRGEDQLSKGEKDHQQTDRPTLVADVKLGEVLTDDFSLAGMLPSGGGQVQLVKNGLLGSAVTVPTNPDGTWSYTYPVENLGEEAFFLVAFDPLSGLASERIEVRSNVVEPALALTFDDPRGDDRGPAGTYIDLQQANAIGQKDILQVSAMAGGDILKIELTMAEVTSEWLPPNQFDNVSFSIFFDRPDTDGASTLPQLNAQMPNGLDWDVGHVIFGWGNTMFSADGASADAAGTRFASAPQVDVDEEARTIAFTYDGSDFGVNSWDGVSGYITTWDIAGEGAYVRLGPKKAQWAFGGGAEDDPKILDDAFLKLDADK
ncbi:MAG: alpha-amylase family glycosyl hydrolase [Pseudomonadota bacterium]